MTTLRRGDQLRQIGQSGTHQSYGSAWANLCNTPLNMYKHFCHEGGLASPLIVQWPARLRPQRGFVREPAHVMDIAPTILDAAGIDYPETYKGRTITPVAGRSLFAACGGDRLSARSLAFEHQRARALRFGDYKVVWSKREPNEIRWRLFDLEKDRAEQHDLSAAQPQRTAELVAMWERWAKGVGAHPFDRSNEEPRERKRDEHPDHPTPRVAGRIVKVRCDVEPRGSDGVIVAQGGRTHGYALHLRDGLLTFDVRIRGRVTRVEAGAAGPARFRAQATLDRDTLTLRVDDVVVATASSPGLLPIQPQDGLDVGSDPRTAAGDYRAPNSFAGKIHAITVDVELPQLPKK